MGGIKQNASLQYIKLDNILIIAEVVDHPNFKPFTVIFGNGVENFADIVDSDVGMLLSSDFQMAVFERVDRKQWQDTADKYIAKGGWLIIGYSAVRLYSTLLVYQSSPG